MNLIFEFHFRDPLNKIYLYRSIRGGTGMTVSPAIS